MFEKCIYFNTNALARQINQVWDEAFKPLGLSPAHAYVLRVVLDQPGISMKHIAETLELAPSTVTRFIDSLVSKGYLSRETDDLDKRGSKIIPTRKAKAIHSALEKTGQALYSEMNKAIGEKPFAELVSKMRNTRQKL